ncbi:6-bladed beta-propeller [Gemmatimonadota bacterium]
MSRLCWILPLLCLGAWSYQTDQSGHSFQIHEENGVTIAETRGGPKYSGDLFIYEKEMVIDTAQSEESLLYSPTQILGDVAGNCFVLDVGLGTILMFDAEGNYVRSIGQKGQGPGEFTIGQIQLIHDDVIQLYDLALRRTTRFGIDGTLIDVPRLPAITGPMPPYGFIVFPDMTRVLFTLDADISAIEIQGGRAVLLSAEHDTLKILNTSRIQVSKQIEVTAGGRTMTTPMMMIFGPVPVTVYHPVHGIVLSTTDTPQLDIYDLTGNLTRTVRIEMDSESVTRADRDWAQQHLLQAFKRMAGDASEDEQEALASAVRQFPFADEKAFWSAVEFDDTGYFWLGLSVLPRMGYGGTYDHLVLSPEGEYLGNTIRPTGSNSSVSHGRLYVLEEDPDSGEILPTIYRIRSAVDGFIYP